jgi:hypothetical protein
LIILDAEGGVRARQETGSLENAEGRDYDAAKVLAFLERWAAKR